MILVMRAICRGATAAIVLSCFAQSFFVLSATAAPADDSDLDALMLADQTPAAVEAARDWRAFFEGAYGSAVLRQDGSTRREHRFSADLQYDHSFSREWRAVFADRLDMNWPAQGGDKHSINTIKEAYLSWSAAENTLLDFGRINARFGVAMGYNPTDWFRSGALRTIVSINPASLKENRQGSVMLRGQRLWDGGSMTALYSPKLDVQPSINPFNPNWGATNYENRWLLAVSQRISDNVRPQWLFYQEGDRPMQLGLNLTSLLNDATVVYAEWSGGRSQSLLSQVLKQASIAHADDTAFRNRISTGVTYTTPNKISLTAELEYNGGGLDQHAWDGLRNGPLPLYGQYRYRVQAVQDLPTKQVLFLYGTWQDAFINHLDLSAMESVAAADSSHRTWLEARYHADHLEYALQWQRNSGKPLSEYGAAAQTRSWQASVRYYF